MAISLGKAEGKITLDASSFVSNINKAYTELEKFGNLVSETQRSLNEGLSFGSSESGSNPFGFDPAAFREVFGNTIPEETEKSRQSVSLLQQALQTGLSAALNGVESLARATFDAFRRYVQETVGFAKSSLETGLNFDATMSKVSAIAGATGEEFDALRDKALEMGATTKFSATQAGEAMSYMGMAGWKTEQILEGIPGIMSLAAASGEDLATTSDIVTDALTAFGLKAEDSSRFADVLAAAATNSNTNVGLMGETFKYVASMAGTMHYSIEDTAVAIGLMANTGIKGSQAGTALRNVITNLAKPSNTVVEAMNDLGISLTDTEGNTKSLMELMKDLRGAFSDLSGDESIKEYQQAISELDAALASGEITEEEYTKQAESAAATILQSTDAVKAKYAAMISGKYGLSGLLAIVNASDEDFENLTRQIYNAGSNLTEVSEAVKNSGVAWDSYIKNAENAESEVKTITNAIVDNINSMSASELQNKLQLDFGLSADDAITAINSVKGALENTAGSAETMEDTMMNNLQGSITIFQSTMESFKIKVSDVLKEPANEIVGAGQNAISELMTALETDGIPGLIQKIRELIPQVLSVVLKYIPEVIPLALDGFWAIVNGVVDAFPEAIPVIANGAMDLFTGLITGLLEATKNLNSMLPGLIKDICDAILRDAPKLLDSAVKLFMELVHGIALMTPDLIRTVAELLPIILQAIIDNLDQIIQGAVEIIMALVRGLTDPETIKSLLVAVGKVIDAIVKVFTDVDWLETANQIFSGLGEGLQGIFEGAMSAIDELLGTNFGEWAKEVNAWFDELKRQSFEFGKYMADQQNMEENKLNQLHSYYGSTYRDMQNYYAELVKSGVEAQEAMKAAYQKYFTSSEAQYVFRERFAESLTQGALAEQIGTVGMSKKEIADLLSTATTVSGNTYVFYSPEPIDEKTAAAEVEKTQKDIINQYS